MTYEVWLPPNGSAWHITADYFMVENGTIQFFKRGSKRVASLPIAFVVTTKDQ